MDISKIYEESMKRPEKHMLMTGVGMADKGYKCTDIDPLLDELMQYRSKYPDPYRLISGERIVTGNMKPAPNFPTLEEFSEWYYYENRTNKEIYDYFSQFQYETKVFPKVGEVYELYDEEDDEWYYDELVSFCGKSYVGSYIRPISTPTREDILTAIKNARKNQPGGHVAIHGKTIDALINELEGEG